MTEENKTAEEDAEETEVIVSEVVAEPGQKHGRSGVQPKGKKSKVAKTSVPSGTSPSGNKASAQELQLLFQSASGEAPAVGDPSEVPEYEVPQADSKTKGGPAETPEVVVCEPCYLCRLSTVGCPRQTLNKGRSTCQFVHNCCRNAERAMQSVAAAMDKEEKSTRHMQSLKKQKQTDAAGNATLF